MSTAELEISGLTAGYGGVVAVKDVSLSVPAGTTVALLGANGAGKSTILRSVSGQVKPRSGDIRLNGESLVGLRPDQTLARGVAHVLEGRQVFAQMTVVENLRLGSVRRGRDTHEETIALLLDHFPVLAEKARQPAGQLSGGQQQMLAISRALMSRPRMLLLDEPSLGLAPVMLPTIVELIRWAQTTFGAAVLIVEQYSALALQVSTWGYVLRNGRLVASAPSAELAEGDAINTAYFGVDP
ncbi:ABC transporter ATP-binding protein [Acrocarpospora catenulata]|uniref:ABC transporter ATP-binding protein n=1 Tax=Acrocarpospora catenulata TaxID=2836182 RepID=UPI001BD99D41|nr:ABC transporter ATP-binding protein [Acrocarpospora catenulata]